MLFGRRRRLSEALTAAEFGEAVNVPAAPPKLRRNGLKTQAGSGEGPLLAGLPFSLDRAEAVRTWYTTQGEWSYAGARRRGAELGGDADLDVLKDAR